MSPSDAAVKAPQCRRQNTGCKPPGTNYVESRAARDRRRRVARSGAAQNWETSMNKAFGRVMITTLGAAAVLFSPAALSADVSSADQAAIYKAAGFTESGGHYVRCKEEVPTMSYSPGQIEEVDLNGDGQPEAWVREGSVFCYGNIGTAFVLLTKAGDRWHVLLDEVGVPVVQPASNAGWPDIEVGGPGFGKFPVYCWNGKAYVLRK